MSGQARSWKRRFSPYIVLNLVFRLSPLAIFFLAMWLAYDGVRTHCEPQPSVGDALYDAVQFFALTGVTCELRPPFGDHATPASLLGAGFLTAFLLFLAILRVFFMPIWTMFRLVTQAFIFKNKRNILIGFGALNQEIARDLAHSGTPMTIVTRQLDGAARDFAASARAVLIERDIRREGALNWLFINRCERIIVACGDDSLTYEVARQIGTEYAATFRKEAAEVGDQAATLADQRAREVVWAHFTSTEMHRQLLRSRDLGLGTERRFSGFSIREETARYLMSRAWLAERAHLAKQDRLHLVVVGGGDLGLSITREALQHGFSAKLKEPPLITVIDKDGAEVKAQFRAAMPRIFDETIPAEDRPVVQFMQCRVEAVGLADAPAGEDTPVPGIGAKFVRDDPEVVRDDPEVEPEGNLDDTLDAEPDDEPKETREEPIVADITGWVICCPEDGQNLTLAMKLETAMRRGLIAPAPIYPRQWQANVSEAERRGLGQADPLHLVAPFGGMDDVVETLSFMDPTLERIARSIHESYQETKKKEYKNTQLEEAITKHGPPPTWEDGKGPPDPDTRSELIAAYAVQVRRLDAPWDELRDEGRLANLEPARLAALRLWELGFDWVGRHAGKLPAVESRVLDEKLGDAASDDLQPSTELGAIAKTEHSRWMVERALRGWSAAKPERRSNEMRLHPNFERFDDLNEDRQSMQGEDLRKYDASTVKGKVKALIGDTPEAEKRALPVIHPDPDASPTFVSLLDDAKISTHVYALSLWLPATPRVEKDEDDASAQRKLEPFLGRLEKGVARVVEWIDDAHASSIRLVPEDADTLDVENTEIRKGIERIRIKARDHNVFLWLDFPDVKRERQEKQKNAAKTED